MQRSLPFANSFALGKINRFPSSSAKVSFNVPVYSSFTQLFFKYKISLSKLQHGIYSFTTKEF